MAGSLTQLVQGTLHLFRGPLEGALEQYHHRYHIIHHCNNPRNGCLDRDKMLPFTFLLVSSRLDEFDYSTIEAARDLGAREYDTMVRVVIPSIFPGILSAFLMALTMSIEDFVITFFVSGPGSTTLPLYVYSSIRYGVSPVINALSLILILLSMAIAFTFRRFLKSFAASA